MTVNLSTRLFYDRSASTMQSLTAQAEKQNARINAQKNVIVASDDSVAWKRLQGIARADADGDAYAGNVSLAKSVLEQSSTALGQIGDQLTKAVELVVQAGNGTYSGKDKAALADQIAGILETVVGLANAEDVRGAPLFGGAGADKAVTANPDGSLTFADGEGATIPIGDGQTVKPSDNATRFLKTVDTDLGATLTAIVTALRAGDAIPADAIGALNTIADQTTAAQASIGARAARVDIQGTQLQAAKTDREETRAAVDGFDFTAAITEMQKTMTVLQATQASFSKLSQLSLFDYLR